MGQPIRIIFSILLISSLSYGEKEDLPLSPHSRITGTISRLRSQFQTPTTEMREMCEQYPDGISCARIQQMTNRMKPCSCSDISSEQIKTDNQEFLDYHKLRIETDIAEINEKLNPLSGHTHLRDWQITNLTRQLQRKEDILKRTLRYIAEFDSLPDVQLIADDLSVDFTVEDCGELTPLIQGERMLTKQISRNFDFNLGNETLRVRCQNNDSDTNLKPESTEATFCLDCQADTGRGLLTESISSNFEAMDEASCRLNSLSCHDDTDNFLRSLGIDPNTSSSSNTERDLSHVFTEPHSQGESSACAGFAVSADIEAEVHKMSLGSFELPPPNPWDTYEVLNGGFSGCQGQTENRNYSSGTLMGPGLANLSNSSLCAEGLDRRYKVESTSALTNVSSVDFDFIRKMIDNEKPFVAGLNSTGARITEDWSSPIPSNSGEDGHVLTVVGYGNGMSPESRTQEPYVIVRDSLNGEAVHTRMRFEDFQQNLSGVWKVQNVSFE